MPNAAISEVCRNLLKTFGVLLAASLVSVAGAAPVTPDSTAAREFANRLQREYGEKKSAAIIAQVDSAAFIKRVFGIEHAEERYPWVAGWRDTLPPPLDGTIQSLDRLPLLAYYRVVLDGNVRTLECEFMDFEGSVQSAIFFLVQAADGTVRISDFQWGGDAMPKSQIIRDSWLLQGVTLPNYHDDEEMVLAEYGRAQYRPFETLTQAYSMGDYLNTYRVLSGLPEPLKKTRIWRHYLTCLDTVHKDAGRDLKRLIAAGEPFDPLVRFRVALADGNRDAALSALKDVSTSRSRPPIYRCIEGSILLAAGRTAEAAAIARETMAEQPFIVFAYILGVRAAIAQRSGDAIDILRAWARIASPAQIDEVLAALDDLKDFRSSKPYLDWKAQPVSLPRPAQ